MDYRYDSPSSALRPAEPSAHGANLAYDADPRSAADAPPRPEATPAGRGGGPPRRRGRAVKAGPLAAKPAASAAAPGPVVLTYVDLAALEAAALLAVGEGLTAPPDADPWEEEQDAEAAPLFAAAWSKLYHARRDGRPVAVERTTPPDDGGPVRT